MAQATPPRSKQNMKQSSLGNSSTRPNIHTRSPKSNQGQIGGHGRGGWLGQGGGQGQGGGSQDQFLYPQTFRGQGDGGGQGRGRGHCQSGGQNRDGGHGQSKGRGQGRGQVNQHRVGGQGQNGGPVFHPPSHLSQYLCSQTFFQQNTFPSVSHISYNWPGPTVGHGHSMAPRPALIRAPTQVSRPTSSQRGATTKQQNQNTTTHAGYTRCLSASSGVGGSIQSPGHPETRVVRELKQGHNRQAVCGEKYGAGSRVEGQHVGVARGGRGRGGWAGRDRGQNSGRAGKSSTGRSLVAGQVAGTNKPKQICVPLGQTVTQVSETVKGNSGDVRKEGKGNDAVRRRRNRGRGRYRVRGCGSGRGSVPATSFADIASTIAHGLASPVMSSLQKFMSNLLLKEKQVGDRITAEDRSKDSEGGNEVPIEISGGRCVRSRTNEGKEIDGRTFQRPLFDNQSGVWYETSETNSENQPSSCAKEEEEELDEEEEDEDELEEEEIFRNREIVPESIGLTYGRQTRRAGRRRFRLHGALRGVRGGFRRTGVPQPSGQSWTAAALRSEEATVEVCDDSDARSQVSDCSGSQVAASDVGSWIDVEEVDEMCLGDASTYQQTKRLTIHSRGLGNGHSRGHGRGFGRGRAVNRQPGFATQDVLYRTEVELDNSQKEVLDDTTQLNRTDRIGSLTEEKMVTVEPEHQRDSNQSGGQSDTVKSSRGKKRSRKTNNKAAVKGDLANSSSQLPFEVEQNLVIEYLVSHHKGFCSLFDLQNNSGLFPCILQPEAVLQSLSHCCFVRVLVDPLDLDSSTVKVYMKKLRLCNEYRPPKGCLRNFCPYVHLCRDFMMDCCNAQKCALDHDVESEHNMKLMINCGIEIFSADQKLSLIRCANLLVCWKHNSSEGCPFPRSCFKMHVCNSYILNRCLIPGDRCLQGHDLFSEPNMKILRLCRLDQVDVKFLLRMVVGFHPEAFSEDSSSAMRKQHKASKGKAKLEDNGTSYDGRDWRSGWVASEQKVTDATASSDQSAEINKSKKHSFSSSLQQNTNLKNFSGTLQEKSIFSSSNNEEPEREKLSLEERQNDVCECFEEHTCDLMEKCTERHGSRTPYLWRVRMHAEWFDVENNELIEEEFSNPAAEKFWGAVWDTTFCIDFLSMMSEVGAIQRLSTPSYAMSRDRADATRWLWYWSDSTGKWVLYGQNNEPPYQDVLEAKFLNDPRHVYCFQINSCNYELDFAKMEQRNLQTNFCRPIRRRPFCRNSEMMEMPSIEDHYYDQSKLPFGWAPMDTESKHGSELVPLHVEDADYEAVKCSFFATLRAANFEIRRIYRLQNLDLWQSFQMKKVTMENKTGNLVEEVNVYHGTPEEETVRWICSLGFDQRMHGRHGAKYGTGVYFATTAKYSHCYTQLSERGQRYMFCARVLVGRTVEGKAEYRRPPPIDPMKPSEGLYDTCVDNVAKPSIYVVFDNSQSYPEYLIEYQDVMAASEAAVHQSHPASATTISDASRYTRSPPLRGAPPSATYPPHSDATWRPAYAPDISSSGDTALPSQFPGQPSPFMTHTPGNYPPYVHSASLSGSETRSSAYQSQFSGHYPYVIAMPSAPDAFQYGPYGSATAPIPSNPLSVPTAQNEPCSFVYPSNDSPSYDPSYSHQQPKNCCVM